MNRKQRRQAAKQATAGFHPGAGAGPGAAVHSVLAAAARHHQAGRFSEAEALYRRFLQARPNHPKALHLLGVLAHQTGRHEAAIELIGRAIAVNDAEPAYHNHFGEAHRALGRFDEAIAHYRRALELQPREAGTHYNLANALKSQGKLEEAAREYRRALKIQPDFAGAHNNLANTLIEQGKADEAIRHYRRALAAKPDDATTHKNLANAFFSQSKLDDAIAHYRQALNILPKGAEIHHNLGEALRQKGELEDAVASFQQAVAIRMDYPEALYNLGRTLKEQEKLEEAMTALRQALAIKPDLVTAHYELGACLSEQDRDEEAIESFRQALAIKPDLGAAHASIGSCLQNLGRIAEATENYHQALAIKPDLARAHAGIGRCLQIMGRFEEAEEWYRQTLALDPDRVGTYLGSVSGRKFTSADEEIAHLKGFLNDKDLGPAQRIGASFALAKIFDDLGRYDEAFTHYRVANELVHKDKSYDAEGDERHVDGLISAFTKEFFEKRASFGVASELPVFIVGMPRSGTTLVEQIIASHSQAFGAGELTEINRMVRTLPKTLNTSTPYPACATLIDRDAARRLATGYLEHLRGFSRDADRITDKAPGNFTNLGFIAPLFPKARIIHCRRDPMDTCLSCYFQNFRHALNFAYDLRDLGLHYRQYQKLMHHWRSVSPMPMLEVSYEELVSNQEKGSREIIDFCGLEWDDKCLAFHELERPIQTASLWQVRQPIYTSSVGRWRQYEKYLGPLKESLGLTET